MDEEHAGRDISVRSSDRRLNLMWKLVSILHAYISIIGMIMLSCAALGTIFRKVAMNSSDTREVMAVFRRWGGFNERPLTETCYRQERIAMALGLIFGSFGIDQWYARHWTLATFKMLIGLAAHAAAIWSFFRPDGVVDRLFRPLSTSAAIFWWLIDMILWIFGGTYGTPGCPGGSSDGWRY